MAPVIQLLKTEYWAEVRVLATGQHRHLLDEALSYFSIKPDFDSEYHATESSACYLDEPVASRAG